MSMNKKTFGSNLKSWRIDRGVSQADFATMMNTSQQRVSEWERGRCEPSLYNIIRMLEILSISFEELVENVMPKK